jgi:hypothetical protein
VSEISTKCRTCGAAEPKLLPGQPCEWDREWLVALPDELEGALLLDSTAVWCSQECMDQDPQHREHESGAGMFDSYNRFGEAHGLDLIGAFARSRGLDRADAEKQLVDGFDRGLKMLRGKAKA